MLPATRHKLTALALAGLYTLIACAGQGLHELTHLHSAFCESSACCESSDNCGSSEVCSDTTEWVASCSCGHESCFFTEYELAQRQSQSTDNAAIAITKPRHDADSCNVCQLLAQMKTAQVGYALPELTSRLLIEAPHLPKPRANAAETRTYDARGPPLWG